MHAKLGEIRKASEIGYRCDAKYIWSACVDCGKERWVHLVKGKPFTARCKRCSGIKSGLANKGINNPAWKGGRIKRFGYIKIKLQPDDFFYPMAGQDGYVWEHRLVVARALGRNLHLWEIIHHKDNCPKDDNRYPETLQLVTEDRHNQITIMEQRIKLLESRVTLLEAENALLKAEQGLRYKGD